MMMRDLYRTFLAASISLALYLPVANAVEGGMGRPLTGEQIDPLAGVVPVEPGIYAGLNAYYYDGASRNSAVPRGHTLEGGTQLSVLYTTLSLTYVWGSVGAWSFASSLAQPFQYAEVSASVSGTTLAGERSDHSTEIADTLLIPLLVGYHFNEANHLAMYVQIYAPTGSYSPDRLSSAGLNYWTFIPTLSYTHLDPDWGMEYTLSWGMQFNTTNPDTHYQSGTLSTLDALAIKRFNNGLGIGLAGGWIQQVSDDRGGLATVLGGYRSQSWGVGPIVTWEGKEGNLPLSLSLRWINEFAVKNRPDGNAFELSLAGQF